MQLFKLSSLVTCALALMLVACSNSSSSDKNVVHRQVDVSQFPSVENTIYGGWASTPQSDKGMTFQLNFYFNAQNELGLSAICSDGFNSVTASTVVKATLANGKLTSLETGADSQQGQFPEGKINCNVSIRANQSMSYQLVGDSLTLSDGTTGQSVSLTRIR